LNYAVEKLSRKIKGEFPNLPNVRWVALRLLEGDQSVIDSITSGELGDIRELKASVEEELLGAG